MTESALHRAINEASRATAAALDLGNFRSLVDDVIEKGAENLLDQINGHALAIWLKCQQSGDEVLTIAYNVGEKGSTLEGVVSQSLTGGLVSKAFKENKVVCHQGLFKHKEQSQAVDKALGQMTAHQIASPFTLFGATLGAVTVVQTLAAGIEHHSEWGFTNDDILHFATGVEVLQRLFELNIIRRL